MAGTQGKGWMDGMGGRNAIRDDMTPFLFAFAGDKKNFESFLHKETSTWPRKPKKKLMRSSKRNDPDGLHDYLTPFSSIFPLVPSDILPPPQPTTAI
ncbi:hypothetical protein VTJ04DRAFT_4532 [Mycothermus thermophilus]|uniref:uncharacterized protein n=1 Tax=Humicola insolens TaxID=85995 RepID=UPI0037435B33